MLWGYLSENGKNLVGLDGQGKPQSQGFIDKIHEPGSLYGIVEALDGDLGTRDLSYSPFLECDILFIKC